MNNRGFTLIELLIVVSILGILVAISVTGYIGVTKKAARSEAYANLQSIRLLEEQFFAENACYQPPAGGVCPSLLSLYGTCQHPAISSRISARHRAQLYVSDNAEFAAD